MLDLRCQTDFAARNDVFQVLGKDLCLNVAANDVVTKDEFMEQDFVKDPARKVKDLVATAESLLGEKIQVLRFTKYEVKKEGN